MLVNSPRPNNSCNCCFHLLKPPQEHIHAWTHGHKLGVDVRWLALHTLVIFALALQSGANYCALCVSFHAHKSE